MDQLDTYPDGDVKKDIFLARISSVLNNQQPASESASHYNLMVMVSVMM